MSHAALDVTPDIPLARRHGRQNRAPRSLCLRLSSPLSEHKHGFPLKTHEKQQYHSFAGNVTRRSFRLRRSRFRLLPRCSTSPSTLSRNGSVAGPCLGHCLLWLDSCVGIRFGDARAARFLRGYSAADALLSRRWPLFPFHPPLPPSRTAAEMILRPRGEDDHSTAWVAGSNIKHWISECVSSIDQAYTGLVCGAPKVELTLSVYPDNRPSQSSSLRSSPASSRFTSSFRPSGAASGLVARRRRHLAWEARSGNDSKTAQTLAPRLLPASGLP